MSQTCPSCSSVHLVARRVHRKNGVAVFFGRILLLPALGLVVLGSMGVVASRAPQRAELDARASAALDSAGVPRSVASHVLSAAEVTRDELAALNEEQRLSVRRAQMTVAEQGPLGGLSNLLAGGGFVTFAALSIASGFVGLRLVRKQRVLQCSSCGTLANPD